MQTCFNVYTGICIRRLLPKLYSFFAWREKRPTFEYRVTSGRSGTFALAGQRTCVARSVTPLVALTKASAAKKLALTRGGESLCPPTPSKTNAIKAAANGPDG